MPGTIPRVEPRSKVQTMLLSPLRQSISRKDSLEHCFGRTCLFTSNTRGRFGSTKADAGREKNELEGLHRQLTTPVTGKVEGEGAAWENGARGNDGKLLKDFGISLNRSAQVSVARSVVTWKSNGTLSTRGTDVILQVFKLRIVSSGQGAGNLLWG